MEVKPSRALTSTVRFASEEAERLLGNLRAQAARTLRSKGAAEVHDLRVIIRRSTRVLVVFKPFFPRQEAGDLRRGLKKIMHRAARVRDRDIALQLLMKQDPHAARELTPQFRAERKSAARALEVSLKRWVSGGLSAKWPSAPGAAEGLDDEPVHAVAASLLPRMAKDYFRRGKEASQGKMPVEDLHRFRIAAKNLRYTLDLFAPVYGDRIAPLVGQIKGVQTAIGDIHDCAVVRRMAAKRGGRGELLASLKKRQQKKTSEFRRRAPEAFESGAAGEWVDRLGRPDGGARVARKPPGRSVAAGAGARKSA